MITPSIQYNTNKCASKFTKKIHFYIFRQVIGIIIAVCLVSIGTFVLCFLYYQSAINLMMYPFLEVAEFRNKLQTWILSENRVPASGSVKIVALIVFWKGMRSSITLKSGWGRHSSVWHRFQQSGHLPASHVHVIDFRCSFALPETGVKVLQCWWQEILRKRVKGQVVAHVVERNIVADILMQHCQVWGNC